jgi:uncharacterized repeat protein (TIGR03803 family)
MSIRVAAFNFGRSQALRRARLPLRPMRTIGPPPPADIGSRPAAAAGAALLLATTLMMPSGGARAASEAVLYSFAGPPFANVQGPLLSDATGALYGTTAGGTADACGFLPGSSVFKLAPPTAPGGRWTKTILHGDSNGFLPSAGLVSDPAGNLYGTAEPGSCVGEPGGTVFRLEKPGRPGGAWVLTVLHTFDTFSDGITPFGLIRDAAGALYGTTTFGGRQIFCDGLVDGCGTGFKLMPPANPGGSWTESVLHRFAGGGDGAFPEISLLAGASGVLYGTTDAGGRASAECPQGCGTVFELDPVPGPAGAAWTETVLYRFKGGADGIAPTGLVAHAGSLYGTTGFGGAADCISGCGTVFRLTPPAVSGQPWTETVLYRFRGRNDGANPNPLIYRGGVFYGTTSGGGASKQCSGCGSVFALTPPAAGAVWTEEVIYSFKGFSREGADGASPNGALVAGKDGRLYGVTSAGGRNGDGTVFAIVP